MMIETMISLSKSPNSAGSSRSCYDGEAKVDNEFNKASPMMDISLYDSTVPNTVVMRKESGFTDSRQAS